MKNNPKLNALHDSFACVLCSIIKNDGQISKEERSKFDDFFKKEFDLAQDTIDQLFETTVQNELDSEKHIELLKEGFSGEMMVKARFMQYLNECVLCDGIGDEEYAVFEMVRGRLF